MPQAFELKLKDIFGGGQHTLHSDIKLNSLGEEQLFEHFF